MAFRANLDTKPGWVREQQHCLHFKGIKSRKQRRVSIRWAEWGLDFINQTRTECGKVSGSDKLQPGLTPSLRVFNEGWGKNLPKEKSNLIQRITKNESICPLKLKQREHLKKGFQQFYTSKSVYNFTTPYVKTRAGKSWKLRGYKASSTRTLDISELLRA